MKRLTIFRSLALPLVLLMVLAACTGGGASAGASEAESEAPESQAPESAGEESTAPSEPAVEPVPFTVAFTSIGVGSMSLLAAIDDLREQGYEIETPEIAESELVTEGGDVTELDVTMTFDAVLKKEVRRAILEEGIRPDGRGLKDIRQLDVEVGVVCTQDLHPQLVVLAEPAGLGPLVAEVGGGVPGLEGRGRPVLDVRPDHRCRPLGP